MYRLVPGTIPYRVYDEPWFRPRTSPRARKSNVHEVFYSLVFFTFFFLPQSIADDRFRRYHPVAGGPRTGQPADQYVPPDMRPYRLLDDVGVVGHLPGKLLGLSAVEEVYLLLCSFSHLPAPPLPAAAETYSLLVPFYEEMDCNIKKRLNKFLRTTALPQSLAADSSVYNTVPRLKGPPPSPGGTARLLSLYLRLISDYFPSDSDSTATTSKQDRSRCRIRCGLGPPKRPPIEVPTTELMCSLTQGPLASAQ
ncbi:hypothetical protein BHE74_00016461 [Ensete ventricosum]|nr:hypothetical protein BHE74_00016461 [Ensete ventricosum]